MSIFMDISCEECGDFLFVYAMGGPLQGTCYCRTCAELEMDKERESIDPSQSTNES